MTKKIVLDTNVYLSGIIFGGNCRYILDLLIEKKLTAVSSPSILLEISQKLKVKFKRSDEQILSIIKTIVETAEIVDPKLKLSLVKEDKSDNKIIEAAVYGKARFIITGDRHLLKIKQYQEIKILSPAQFLSEYFPN